MMDKICLFAYRKRHGKLMGEWFELDHDSTRLCCSEMEKYFAGDCEESPSKIIHWDVQGNLIEIYLAWQAFTWGDIEYYRAPIWFCPFCGAKIAVEMKDE